MSSMPEFTTPVTPVSETSLCPTADPHLPHRTTFAPAIGGATFDCPGIDVERAGLLNCPEWCVADHGDELVDPVMNVALHRGGDAVDGYVRRVLEAEQNYKLDIEVNRVDCPEEGRVGKPVLHVRADVEITTWEQAAELARSILDGFGYLQGAER